MGSYFGIIVSLMPENPAKDYLHTLLLEAERATTWEIRLDAFGKDLAEGLWALGHFREKFAKKKVIFTLRPSGETFKHPFDRWRFWEDIPKWLRTLIKDSGNEVYVDWELDLIQWVQANKLNCLIPWTKIGASYHDFEGGHKLEYLDYCSRALRLTKAKAFLKFVIMAKHHRDIGRLRDLASFYTEDPRPFIFFAMGKEGEESRRKCLVWGSAGTYGYLPGRASAAPGQLSIQELLSDADVRKIVQPD